MKVLLRAAKALFTIYGFVLFIIVMLVLFPFVFIASLFGKEKGGNIIYLICQGWSDVMLLLWGIRHRHIYESPHNSQQQYVFVFNHISYMDIPLILVALRKQHFRIMGKAEMAKVPVFGLFYRNAVVMVDRSNADKRATSFKKLKSVIHKGISVVIAPEGTFNTSNKPLKEFYDGAFRIAIETQTPIKPILFLDNYKRMSYKSFFLLTPGIARVVYLDEVPVEGLTTRDVKMLKEKVYAIMADKLSAYHASWINVN